MKIHFSKYHGLGNDFVVIDDPSLDRQLVSHLSPKAVQAICHRWEGIGADGILVRAPSDKADHAMILFNSDGSSAEISGNGLRCFVLFLKDQGYPVSGDVTIETGGGVQIARLIDAGIVESTMPPPDFAASGGNLQPLELEGNGKRFGVLPVNVGNPHGVIFGPERDLVFAETYGPSLEKHSVFPEGANIEFVHVTSERACRLVVWERGAGITMACGSGSVATACAGAATGRFAFDVPIAVSQPGGTLEITVARDFREVRQRGPAEFVFKGEVEV